MTHAARFCETEQSLLDAVRRLDRARYDLKALFLGLGDAAEAYERAGIPTRAHPIPDYILKATQDHFFTPGRVVSSVKSARTMYLLRGEIAEEVRKTDADLVLTNSGKAHVLAALAVKDLRVPVVWHIQRHYGSALARLALRMLARRGAAAVVCCSRFTAAQFHGMKSAGVVYSGVAADDLAPETQAADMRARLGIPDDAPVVGMAADFGPNRGYRTFLRAAARIREDVKNARFLIAGRTVYAGQDYTGRLRELAADYGIADAVVFTGFGSNEADVMQVMDVFAHAAPAPEPFGRNIVKAMMLGRPVVAAGRGGPEEILRHVETGLLVEPGDSVALARAAVQLLDNPDVARVFGENGRARALDKFSMDKTVAAWQTILDGVLS